MQRSRKKDTRGNTITQRSRRSKGIEQGTGKLTKAERERLKEEGETEDGGQWSKTARALRQTPWQQGGDGAGFQRTPWRQGGET